METTVYLIRHGITDWHSLGKVLGQRDIPLNSDGREQMQATARALHGVKLVDVLTSPLQRAVASAEIIGDQYGIDVARDPRLIEFRLGKWSGMTHSEVAANPEYQRFLANPESERIPEGENLEEIRSRSVSAVEQALGDSPSGDAIAIITHAGIIRVLLAHYLGSPPANYHRIRVSPGSISMLSFADDRELPRILAVNHGGPLVQSLGEG